MTRPRPKPIKARRKVRDPLPETPGGLLALDTETTGLDLWHGCRPFFVSACDEAGNLYAWEWDVDPETREVLPGFSGFPPPGPGKGFPPEKELAEIHSLSVSHTLVFHNAKFDLRALEFFNLWNGDQVARVCQDTLIASHLLASGGSHKLKDLALMYLDIDDTDQQELREATNQARTIGRRKGWRIAAPGDPHFPALKRAPKQGFWVFDTWLPRAVAKAEGYPVHYKPDGSIDPERSHPWWSILQTYALRDVERTMGLWLLFREALKEEGLWNHYQTRRRLLEITYRMESHGITAHPKRIDRQARKYREAQEESRAVCLSLAGNKLDNLASPKQVQGVLYGTFKLKPIKETKTGYSTDAETLEALKASLPPRSKAARFIHHLQATRKRDKMLDYLESYHKAGLPGASYKTSRAGFCGKQRTRLAEWLTLHPSFNVTGTATTRFSSSNPNAQNISKQEAYNLREVFGPLPGREWWSLDYKNIEKRIPVYLAGEKELIKLFEEGGSYHLLVASILRPEMLKRLGPERFKKTDEYGWIKNGNFAEQYGAGEKTTDATLHVPGGYRKIKGRFKKVACLGQEKIEEAQRTGRVICLGGYPLEVPFTHGRVDSTKPFNYFVQGSAGWALILAMIRVDGYLQTLTPAGQRIKPDSAFASLPPGEAKRLVASGYRMIMCIHDELVFDFPVCNHPSDPNLQIIDRIAHLMEQSGMDLGLPTPVASERVTTDWAHGEAVAA